MDNKIFKTLENTHEIIKWAKGQDVTGLKRFFEESPEKPLICIGSGGSLSTCKFIALMYSTRKGLGTAVTPYSVYSISEDVLKTCKILLVSNSGHNKDITAIAKRCRQINPEWTANLTTADGTKNDLKKIISPMNSFNYESGIKDGFISINSVTANYALALKAFKGDFEIEFNNSEDDGGFDYRGIKHYIVLYGGWDFDSDYVDYILEKYKDEHVNVLIDSTGGLVGTALSVAAAFRRHGNVSVHMVGLNASAATIASLGAKHISIDKAAMYLVHKCSTSFFKWAQLNADQFDELIKDLAKTKENLDKFDLNASRQYAARCKRKPEDMLELMAKEQWLTAQEALEWGFVDEITELEDEKAPELTEGLVDAMAAAGMPLPPLPNLEDLKDGKQSGLMSLLKTIATLFKGNEKVAAEVSENLKITNNNSISMKKILTLLCAVLAVDAFKLEDGKFSMTEQQLDTIEAALSEKDSKISDQTKEIEELKKLNQDLQVIGAIRGDSDKSVGFGIGTMDSDGKISPIFRISPSGLYFMEQKINLNADN